MPAGTQLLTLMLACYSAGAPTEPRQTTARSEHARFLVEPGAERGAANLAHALDAAVPKLNDYFGESVLGSRGIRPVVYVYATASDWAEPGRALTRSGTKDGTLTTFYADIHQMGSASGATAYGEPRSEGDLQRVLIHEYASIMLDVVLRASPDGWELYESPDWFYQGYPEYLSMHYSTPHARQVTRELALDHAAGRWESAYAGGLARLEYLHERHGRDRLLQLLRSEQPEFEAAFREVYRVELAELDEDVLRWLETR